MHGHGVTTANRTKPATVLPRRTPSCCSWFACLGTIAGLEQHRPPGGMRAVEGVTSQPACTMLQQPSSGHGVVVG